MADPLSLVASITAVITFTGQAGKLIDDFVSSYRDTNSELEEVGTEIRLLEAVLGELKKTYRSHTASTGSATSDGQGEEGKSAPTDTTLKTVLDGLNQCMKQLKDVVAKSYERMERGGLHKIKVQTVWKRTSKGIDKIRMSLFGYKMTLMLLLEAKTFKTTKSPKVTEAAVQAALKKAEPYRNGIAVGEKTLIEVRRYLDDIEDIPSEPSDVQIGATDAVQTFRGFDEWIASFSASPSQQQEDDRLVDALRTRDKSTKEDERCGSPLASENPGVTGAPQSKVLLIVTNLQRPTSKETSVEQLFVDANIEVMEVLQILKDKGYSNVTGFQTRGPNKEGTMGPIYPVSGPMPVVVTTGRSCYDVSRGLRINQDETFVSFYNRYIMQRRPQRSELLVTRKLDSIHIKDSLMDEGCTISFRRTLRVPDDMDTQNTPGTFGPFPLIDISRCETARVPPQIKEKGGLLIPLLQREALCVAFDSGRPPERGETKCLFSARLFAGSLNAISGRPSTERADDLQDYIVIPLQDRVDGFNDADGRHVKQFVAAPLGSGYSVESQLAENEIGGLQLQIAPRLKTCVRFERIGAVDGNRGAKLPLMRSPQDAGLANGQVIQMAEKKDFSLIAPWNWAPAKDGPPTDLMNRALRTWSECERSAGNGGSCWRCLPGPRYWQTIRPAYLSDLLNDARIEQQGALAVSALSPISVTLRHFTEGRGDAPEHMLFFTTIQVSPFERVPVLECRILHLLELRWEEHSIRRPMVTIRGSNWRDYEARRGEHYTRYISIQTLGITEGSVIETVESLQAIHDAPLPAPPPPRKPAGWEMALAGGGTIRQGIKVNSVPGDWNWDAAHFINIQILNTVAFESVTGLAPPPSPISFAEYSEAGIPSMSFYPDNQTYPPVRGKFPVLRTVGEMDGMLGVTYAARLSADGNPIGCVVCERRICDAVLEPCHHAFCTTCIRFRMRRAGHITCLLCSKASTKMVISSAPMDISYLAAPVSQEQQAQDLSRSPSRAPTRTDSLLSLCALERIMGMTLRWNDDKEAKEVYVRSMLKQGGTEGESDLKCRLALAQLLKDIDYPWQPPADFIVAAVKASLGEFIQDYRHDLLEILLGISVCSEDQSALSGSILRRACSHRTEEFAKRLVDEGYEWRTLKKKFRKDEKREWSGSEEVRQRILMYGREGQVSVKKTVLEFEGAESITS